MANRTRENRTAVREAAWKAHAQPRNLQVDTLPRTGPYRYEAQYEKFILEMFDPRYYYKDFTMFTNMKADRRELGRLGVPYGRQGKCTHFGELV